MSKPLRNGLFRRLHVSAVDQLCDDAVAVSLDVPDPLSADFAFRPGQSLTLRRVVDGREHRRSYSICSPIGAAPRIGVREVQGGLFSSWLVRDVRVGDTLEVQAPSGTFVADPDAGQRHVLIAAGSGITPVLSIAASVLLHPSARVTILYGNRNTASVMFLEELSDLKDRFGPRVQLVHVLSRESRGADAFSGRLDGDRLRLLLSALVPVGAVDHFWLCGPHGVVAAAETELRRRGVGKERIHRELFFVAGGAPRRAIHADGSASRPVSDVTVILNGSASTLTVPRDAPVLDSAQHVRDDLPFSCKGGVCGTCRAKVTAGAVEMLRNYALEDVDVDGGFVLICQSLPVTDSVTVDFDA